jgi:hypothetical protein
LTLCHCSGMKASATTGNRSSMVNRPTRHNLTFARVLDGRKQPIRGRWISQPRSRYSVSLHPFLPSCGPVALLPRRSSTRPQRQAACPRTIWRQLAELVRTIPGLPKQ